MLTRPDQRPATLVELLVRHAVRSDVCGALLETHRALEVLLTWMVLRDCEPAEDEDGEDPRERCHVLSHRSHLLPASSLLRASQAIGLRRAGVAIGRTA